LLAWAEHASLYLSSDLSRWCCIWGVGQVTRVNQKQRWETTVLTKSLSYCRQLLRFQIEQKDHMYMRHHTLMHLRITGKWSRTQRMELCSTWRCWWRVLTLLLDSHTTAIVAPAFHPQSLPSLPRFSREPARMARICSTYVPSSAAWMMLQSRSLMKLDNTETSEELENLLEIKLQSI